ncbi:sigma factor [Asanoa sp. NPDC049518]|uniref:RNA polymerase sigma factor n=1 Tax=unclassified Asanoa TaxID=2685164 RepID=UPI003448A508
MDDDELIAAVAGGDDAALRVLFTRHAPWLAARLRAVLPAADVEDVLQETFLAVWRGAAGYRHDNAGGWLWGIARRQAALWLRRRRNPEQLLSALAMAGDTEPHDPGRDGEEPGVPRPPADAGRPRPIRAAVRGGGR